MIRLAQCEPLCSCISTPGSLSILVPIPDLTQSHFIILFQEELLIVSTRTSFTVALHLTRSISPLIALVRRGRCDAGDGSRTGRRRSRPQTFRPHRTTMQWIGFPLRRSMNKPLIVIGDAIRNTSCCVSDMRIRSPIH